MEFFYFKDIQFGRESYGYSVSEIAKTLVGNSEQIGI